MAPLGSPVTGSAIFRRIGVDPAEPSPPMGLASRTFTPSCSSTASRMAVAAGAADVEVGGVAAPLGADREGVLGREPSEGQQRDGPAEGHGDHDVGGVGLGDDDLEHAVEGEEHHRPDDQEAPAPPGRHHAAVDGDQHGGGHRHGRGRHRPALPGADDAHAERARSLDERGRHADHHHGDEEADEQDDHVAPALVEGAEHDGAPADDGHEPAVEQVVDPAEEVVHRRAAGPGHRFDQLVLGDPDGLGGGGVGGEHDPREGDEPGHAEPEQRGAVEVLRQRRRLAGRAPAQARWPARRR